MERRLAGRTSSLPYVTGSNLALMLVVALLTAMLPGQAARASSDDRPDRARPVAGVAMRGGDIADIAWDLGYDIEAIYRFVADQIRYEPYPGILRGARGTLAAGAGNSVDKALLLAALLEESAVPYRFARGSLDKTSTAGLLDSIAIDAAGARLIAEDDFTRGWDELVGSDIAAARPVDDSLSDPLDEQAGQAAADAAERIELAESRLSETVTMIETALDGAGIRLPAESISLPATEMDDHTWVQVLFGADWLDLDPTLATSEPGTVLTPAAETLIELPDELRHRVEFAVLVERVAGGTLVTDPTLEYAAYADEIAGVPVTFGHNTPSGLERFGVALRNVLGDGRIDYRPTLQVGRVSLVADEGVGFGFAGTDAEGGLLEDSELFDDVASPTNGAGPADGEATAEWLEVRVIRPGSEPAVARRTVFDRLPEDLRGSGAATVEAVQPIELVDLDGSGSSDYPPMLGNKTFAIATGPTSAASVVGMSPDERGMFAYTYHMLRDAMAARLGLDAGARTFVDGPNIVSLSLDVAPDAQAPTARIGLDIWHRDHGILPLTGLSVTAPEAALVAGITDYMAERFAFEGLDDVPRVERRTTGVGELFEAATTQGVPIRVLQGSEPGSLPYGTMATLLIEDALASGDVVVIPAEPVIVGDTERVGWWRIDPATGVASDVMDDGSGQEVVEYATLENGRVQQFVCFGSMSHWAAGLIIEAAAMVATLSQSGIFRALNAPGAMGNMGARCFAL